MRKIVLLLNLLCAGMSLTGCSEKEIELYDQPNCINFDYRAVSITFTDEDYLKGKVDSLHLLRVQLQGDMLTENRTYCLKTVEREGYKSMTAIEYENPYTYDNLEGVTDELHVRILRPEKPTDGVDKPCGALIVFDLDNPAHQFAKGREDKGNVMVSVAYKFKPEGYTWEDWRWGNYSYGKYCFMIDTMKALYNDIPYGDESVVKEAYKEYLKTHDPILDDEGNPIEWPGE